MFVFKRLLHPMIIQISQNTVTVLQLTTRKTRANRRSNRPGEAPALSANYGRVPCHIYVPNLDFAPRDPMNES